MTDLKETLINIAKAIVDHPDDVNVLATEEGNKAHITRQSRHQDNDRCISTDFAIRYVLLSFHKP